MKSNPMLSPFYKPKFTDVILSRFVLGIVVIILTISFLDKKKPTE